MAVFGFSVFPDNAVIVIRDLDYFKINRNKHLGC